MKSDKMKGYQLATKEEVERTNKEALKAREKLYKALEEALGMLVQMGPPTSRLFGLMDLDEASRILGVPLETLQGLIAKGEVHGFRLGREWKMRKADVIFLLAQSLDGPFEPAKVGEVLVNGRHSRVVPGGVSGSRQH